MYLTQQTFPPADMPYGDRVLLIKAISKPQALPGFLTSRACHN
jgi:hypothetical protein